MKIERDKDWWVRQAQAEGESFIGAGFETVSSSTRKSLTLDALLQIKQRLDDEELERAQESPAAMALYQAEKARKPGWGSLTIRVHPVMEFRIKLAIPERPYLEQATVQGLTVGPTLYGLPVWVEPNMPSDVIHLGYPVRNDDGTRTFEVVQTIKIKPVSG